MVINYTIKKNNATYKNFKKCISTFVVHYPNPSNGNVGNSIDDTIILKFQ